MINDLNIAPRNPVSTNLQRMIRNAQWRANLPFAQQTVYVYSDANGVLSLQLNGGTGTLLATVPPNPQYLSGMREEWRELFQQMGDRTY